MTTDISTNRAFARKWNEELFQKRNLDAIDEMVAPNAVLNQAGSPNPLYGPCDVRKWAEGLFTAFPDMKVQIEDIVADEQQVAVHFVASGTHEGEFMGIPATGQTITIHGTSFQRIEDGRVVEEWEVVDLLGLLRQLGVIEAPAG